jgi:hypothetical protein
VHLSLLDPIADRGSSALVARLLQLPCVSVLWSAEPKERIATDAHTPPDTADLNALADQL